MNRGGSTEAYSTHGGCFHVLAPAKVLKGVFFWLLAFYALASIHLRFASPDGLGLPQRAWSFLLSVLLPCNFVVAWRGLSYAWRKCSPVRRRAVATGSRGPPQSAVAGGGQSAGARYDRKSYAQLLKDAPPLGIASPLLLSPISTSPMRNCDGNALGTSHLKTASSHIQAGKIAVAPASRSSSDTAESFLSSPLSTEGAPMFGPDPPAAFVCLTDTEGPEAETSCLQLSQLLPLPKTEACWRNAPQCAAQPAQQAHMYGCMGSDSDGEHSGGGRRTHVLSVKCSSHHGASGWEGCRVAMAAAAAALAQENRPHMRLLPVSTLCVEEGAAHLLMVVRPLTDSAVFEDRNDCGASFFGSGPCGACPVRHMELSSLAFSDPGMDSPDEPGGFADDPAMSAVLTAALQRMTPMGEDGSACRVRLVQQQRLALTWPPALVVAGGHARAATNLHRLRRAQGAGSASGVMLSADADALQDAGPTVAVLVPRALLRGLGAVRCVVGGPMGRVLADGEVAVAGAADAAAQPAADDPLDGYNTLRLCLPSCAVQHPAALLIHLLPPAETHPARGSAPAASLALLVLRPAAAAEVRLLFQDMLGAAAVTAYGALQQPDLCVAAASARCAEATLSGTGWSAWGANICGGLEASAEAATAHASRIAEPLDMSPSAAACLESASASMYSFSFDFGALLQLPQSVKGARREVGCSAETRGSPATSPDLASSFLPLLRFLASRRMVACLREGLAALAGAGVVLAFGEASEGQEEAERRPPHDTKNAGQAALEGFIAVLSHTASVAEANAVAGAATDVNMGPAPGSVAAELAAAEAEVEAAAAFEAALGRDDAALSLKLSSARGLSALAAAASMITTLPPHELILEVCGGGASPHAGALDKADVTVEKGAAVSGPSSSTEPSEPHLPVAPGVRWWLRSLLLGFQQPGMEAAYQWARARQCAGLDATGLMARLLVNAGGAVRALQDAWAPGAAPTAAGGARAAAAQIVCAVAILLAAYVLPVNARYRPLLLVLGFALEYVLAGAACWPDSWAWGTSRAPDGGTRSFSLPDAWLLPAQQYGAHVPWHCMLQPLMMQMSVRHQAVAVAIGGLPMFLHGMHVHGHPSGAGLYLAAFIASNLAIPLGLDLRARRAFVRLAAKRQSAAKLVRAAGGSRGEESKAGVRHSWAGGDREACKEGVSRSGACSAP